MKTSMFLRTLYLVVWIFILRGIYYPLYSHLNSFVMQGQANLATSFAWNFTLTTNKDEASLIGLFFKHWYESFWCHVYALRSPAHFEEWRCCLGMINQHHIGNWDFYFIIFLIALFKSINCPSFKCCIVIVMAKWTYIYNVLLLFVKNGVIYQLIAKKSYWFYRYQSQYLAQCLPNYNFVSA